MVCSCKVNEFGKLKKIILVLLSILIKDWCRVLPRCNKPLDDFMLDRGHKWLLMHLIAIYALFNACEDVAMQRTACQTVHKAVARELQRNVRIGTSFLRQHMLDRFATATQTARQTIGIHRRPASDDTILRRLADHNLKWNTPRYRQERLQWATTRPRWRQQQWRNIIFTVESRYCMSIADERKSQAQTRR